MMMAEPVTLDSITDSMRADIEDLFSTADDPGDLAHEIADSHIPIYTADLLDLAATHPELLLEEPEILGADWFPPALRIVVGNLYERLYTIAAEIIEEMEVVNA